MKNKVISTQLFKKKRMLLVHNDIASSIGSERLHGLAHEILVPIAYT